LKKGSWERRNLRQNGLVLKEGGVQEEFIKGGKKKSITHSSECGKSGIKEKSPNLKRRGGPAGFGGGRSLERNKKKKKKKKKFFSGSAKKKRTRGDLFEKKRGAGKKEYERQETKHVK